MGHSAQAAQIALNGRQRDLRTHGDHFKLHDRADAVFVIHQHLARPGALAGRERRQQASDQVSRQVLGNIDLFIDIQRADGGEQRPIAHVINQVVPDVIRGFQ